MPTGTVKLYLFNGNTDHSQHWYGETIDFILIFVIVTVLLLVYSIVLCGIVLLSTQSLVCNTLNLQVE